MSSSELTRPSPRIKSLLGTVCDVAAAGIGVVFLERLEDTTQRDSVVQQFVGIDLHFVGFQFAAERIHLDHAGHAAQLKGDLPIQNRA